MPRVSFEQLPDHGQLWVFPLSRRLTDSEADRCMAVVDTFLDGWAAHGVPLRCARELHESHFLMIGVDIDAEAPSGCSIDALVGQLRALGADLGVTFIDHSPVWFREGDEIHLASRAEFGAMARAATISSSGHVFDTSLTKVGQARNGWLERPAAETWHGPAFFEEPAQL